MVEERLSPSDRVLLTLHNLGVVGSNAAKSIGELADLLRMSLQDLQGLLRRHEELGYVGSLLDEEQGRRYFLTGQGIIKVCSSFS